MDFFLVFDIVLCIILVPLNFHLSLVCLRERYKTSFIEFLFFNAISVVVIWAVYISNVSNKLETIIK